MQLICVSGRLGRDAAVRQSSDGREFISFSVAADSFRNGETKTTWFDVTTGNTRRYQNMVQYLKKGKGVVVYGELSAGLFDGQDGEKRIRLSISADSINFADGSKSDGDASSESNKDVQAKAAPVKAEPKVKPKKVAKVEPEDIPMTSADSQDDDDLPF